MLLPMGLAKLSHGSRYAETGTHHGTHRNLGYRRCGYHAGYRRKAGFQTRGCHAGCHGKAGFQARSFHSGFHGKGGTQAAGIHSGSHGNRVVRVVRSARGGSEAPFDYALRNQKRSCGMVLWTACSYRLPALQKNKDKDDARNRSAGRGWRQEMD